MKRTGSRPYSDLKSWRAAAGLNQRDAAKRLGISQTKYSRLERGVRACKGQQAKRIMLTTGVPLEILVGAA